MLFECMESKYKEALRNLRSSENSLFKGFSVPWSYRSFEQASLQTLPSQEVASSEKKQIIESLKDYTQEKFDEKPVIKFKGGEVAPSVKGAHSGISVEDLDELIEKVQAFSKYNPRMDQRYRGKSTSEMKVLFVSDTFIDEPSEASDMALKELHLFFDTEVSALFDRMIKAMGLEFSEYLVSALQPQKYEDISYREFLVSEVLFYKPRYIVTLGAKAVNELLGTQNRLKNIHGQFFDLQFTDQNDIVSGASLMPLFSPKLLHIAPNMKQTAWKDMQKLMEKIAN